MPIVPTQRLVVLAFVATGVAVLAGFVPAVQVPLIVLDFVILVATIGDVIATLGDRLRVERSTSEIFSIGRPNVVTVTIRNRSPRTIDATIGDDPLGDALAEGLPARTPIAPHATIIVRYEITPTRRGPRRFRAVTVHYPGPLGLCARRERFELPADVDVYPDVHAARSLELLRRQGRKDARLGSLRVRGGDTDFERLRPYTRGDEPRHVDWRATARRDDLTVRQFQAESDQNVIFALDIGRAMRGQESGGATLTAVDHAMNAALLAADVALRGGDKAGLVVFDDGARTWLPPTGGRSGARKLTRAIYALDAGLAATDHRAWTSFLGARVKTRSLVIIFTNVLDSRSAKELAGAVKSLLPRHLPLCVLMRDLDIEALATARVEREDDLYVRAAAAEALEHRSDLIRGLRHAGVLVLDAKPSEVTPELVKSYLDIKARRLL
jgi:uncharacterized protein (DUF58 family)